uniref:Uncharacterized protein n=1 Tax=Timema bartmani TaxID=61472 RepID=A0A7R9I4X5_9NEOP|nr:unnamed protein product [Timema bartmani]
MLSKLLDAELPNPTSHASKNRTSPVTPSRSSRVLSSCRLIIIARTLDRAERMLVCAANSCPPSHVTTISLPDPSLSNRAMSCERLFFSVSVQHRATHITQLPLLHLGIKYPELEPNLDLPRLFHTTAEKVEAKNHGIGQAPALRSLPIPHRQVPASLNIVHVVVEGWAVMELFLFDALRILLDEPLHPTEIRTSILPPSAVELNTTSALANYATEAGEIRGNQGKVGKEPVQDRIEKARLLGSMEEGRRPRGRPGNKRLSKIGKMVVILLPHLTTLSNSTPMPYPSPTTHPPSSWLQPRGAQNSTEGFVFKGPFPRRVFERIRLVDCIITVRGTDRCALAWYGSGVPSLAHNIESKLEKIKVSVDHHRGPSCSFVRHRKVLVTSIRSEEVQWMPVVIRSVISPKTYLTMVKGQCSGDEWTDEAIDMFEELARVAKWELMMARVNCYKERSSKRAKRAGSPVPCVELYDTSNKQHAECEAPSFITKIFDGATVIHVLPIVETSTLKEYSDVMFLPWLHTQQHIGKRIPATSQEEVDSRIVLRIISAAQSGLRSIMTNSVDTDVFVILIGMDLPRIRECYFDPSHLPVSSPGHSGSTSGGYRKSPSLG